MENNHDIDKKFNEASQSLEEPVTFPGFDKVWAKVEQKLDKKEDKMRIVPIWFPYGIAASLIIGLGAFYFIDKNDVSEINKPQIAQNTVSPKTNSSVQATDSLVKSNIEKEIQSQKNIQKPEVLAYESIIPASVINNDVVSNQILRNFETAVEVLESQVDYRKDTLKEKSIEEVVITNLGYTKMKIENLIAATVPKSNGSNNISTMSVQQALVGRLAGVDISFGSGTPGSSKTIIRGLSTLNGGSQPLYVINGVPQNDENFRKLNPKSIKSIDVLKESSLASIYGNCALNGVIVITTKKLSRKERKAFERLQKIQDSINVSKQIQKQNAEEYDAFVENPFELTKNQSVSTFSIDVDKAAYSNIRRMINNGEYVNKNAVRIEEMINYFKYNYPQPKNNQPFSINTEYNDAPWNPKHKLLKIGLQGKNIPMDKLPSSNFVFLIDVSGSMDAANKLPLLKSSFKVLLDQLRPQDKVGIVVYAGSAGMVLPPTSAKEKNKIIEALDKLQAGGSTAGGQGIELAYKLAQENFIKSGNNRVIIATDGDFNMGTSSTGDLQTLIEEKRKSGVFLTCLGFGMGNFKDNRMETLANKGNGNYAYIDNMQEANKFLGKEFAGSMYAIAKDVKIQIEFNPKYVKSYRLIGYENRKLKNEDFTNDKIDAGELGSGHTVTALYEVIPTDVKSEFLPKENDLKYTKNTNDENFNDELATIKFRYKKPDGDKSTEISQIVKNSGSGISAASPDFKFATSVAWFGLVLRDSKLIKNKNINAIESLAKQGKSRDEEGYRSEFIGLVQSYKNIQK